MGGKVAAKSPHGSGMALGWLWVGSGRFYLALKTWVYPAYPQNLGQGDVDIPRVSDRTFSATNLSNGTNEMKL